MFAVVAFYNIGWQQSRFRNLEQHKMTLKHDLSTALGELGADCVLLSECGVIETGLDKNMWLSLLRSICGEGFAMCHQSHYTSGIHEG